jgi:solute carrier family 25 phosphate transporter 23/24/25/41
MSAQPEPSSTHRRDVFEEALSGAQTRPFIPRLRSDPSPWHPLPRTLADYREIEGKEQREARLRALWRRLPSGTTVSEHDERGPVADHANMNPERAERLRVMYEDELMRRCGGTATEGTKSVDWKDFLEYADKKEAGKWKSITIRLSLTSFPIELWSLFHQELDLDNNGHLDAEELAEALGNAGMELSSSQDTVPLFM